MTGLTAQDALTPNIIAVGEEMLEGYHVHVGGGFGAERGIALELQRDVLATDAPAVIERIVRAYLEHRKEGEVFTAFARRVEIAEIKALMEEELRVAS